jgi:hypothetical protein
MHWQQVLEAHSYNGFLLSSVEERVEQFKIDTGTALKVLLPSELRILTPHSEQPTSAKILDGLFLLLYHYRQVLFQF